MNGIIAATITTLVGVMVWYLKCQTKRQNKREDKRDERDAKREEKILNIVDVTLKDVEKSVTKDSENTAKVERTMNKLEGTISNDLVHTIKDLTVEIRKMRT